MGVLLLVALGGHGEGGVELEFGVLVGLGDDLGGGDGKGDYFFADVGGGVEEEDVVGAGEGGGDVDEELGVIHCFLDIAKDSLIILINRPSMRPRNRIMM